MEKYEWHTSNTHEYTFSKLCAIIKKINTFCVRFLCDYVTYIVIFNFKMRAFLAREKKVKTKRKRKPQFYHFICKSGVTNNLENNGRACRKCFNFFYHKVFSLECKCQNPSNLFAMYKIHTYQYESVHMAIFLKQYHQQHFYFVYRGLYFKVLILK